MESIISTTKSKAFKSGTTEFLQPSQNVKLDIISRVLHAYNPCTEQPQQQQQQHQNKNNNNSFFTLDKFRSVRIKKGYVWKGREGGRDGVPSVPCVSLLDVHKTHN